MHNHAYLQIEGITLLSDEEAERIPKDIRDYGEWWWLRSPGLGPHFIASVDCDGDVFVYGDVINLEQHVRPALIIPELEDLNLEKYKDSVEVFDREWIYIGDSMVLAEKPIFYSRFDEYSNDYGTSEIKQRLEDWLEAQIVRQQ